MPLLCGNDVKPINLSDYDCEFDEKKQTNQKKLDIGLYNTSKRKEKI